MMSEQANNEVQRKECPYCGEAIALSAKKCRFCGEWLEEPSKGELHDKELTNEVPVYSPSEKPLETNHVDSTEEETDDSGNNNFLGLIAILLILLLVAYCGMTLYWVFSGEIDIPYRGKSGSKFALLLMAPAAAPFIKMLDSDYDFKSWPYIELIVVGALIWLGFEELWISIATAIIGFGMLLIPYIKYLCGVLMGIIIGIGYFSFLYDYSTITVAWIIMYSIVTSIILICVNLYAVKE